MTPRQAAILRALPTGADNAMTGRQLWERIGEGQWSESARRLLSKDIETLWAQGCVICASKNVAPLGYFRPRDPAELERFICQSKAQASKEEARIRTAEDALEAMRSPVQGSLFGEVA